MPHHRGWVEIQVQPSLNKFFDGISTLHIEFRYAILTLLLYIVFNYMLMVLLVKYFVYSRAIFFPSETTAIIDILGEST